MLNQLERTLTTLPNTSGVYKFLNEKGEILYIGKATNLKSRVSSYFKTESNDRPRIRQMMPLVNDIEIVETNNDTEALILESALVRKHMPVFNTALKDDKSYAWIYITTDDDFPTVKIVRSLKKGEYKKNSLFGPYPSGFTVKRVYTYLRKLYPFCTCINKDCKSSLYYHIGLCPGPYAGDISKEDYRKNINNIIKFLSGKQQNHIKRLEKEMNFYSKNLEYEKATQLRDRIRDLKYIGQDIDFTYYDDTQSYESRRAKTRRSSFEYLEQELGIKNLNRIECFDISNMQGKNAYGSMVVALDGQLDRSEYRIFKIESNKPNDYQMLREVLERRFKRSEKLPQLLLIDGGKGQISSVLDIIPKSVCIMGISKGKHLKKKGRTQIDEFWIVKNSKILRVDIVSPEILIDLRNEAHRFAISYYRKRSLKRAKMSVLDSVDGVGYKRKRALLKRFGSIEGIKKASFDEINLILRNKGVTERVINTLITPSHS